MYGDVDSRALRNANHWSGDLQRLAAFGKSKYAETGPRLIFRKKRSLADLEVYCENARRQNSCRVLIRVRNNAW